MSWSVTIWLKSSKYIKVEELNFINVKSKHSSSTVTEFRSFYLDNEQLLTFVGETIVTLLPSEIEYIVFNEDN